MTDHTYSEETALLVARLIDWHDQPNTQRRQRQQLQAHLRDIFDAPTTETLSRARKVRKWCVALGIYQRPDPRHELPSYLYRPIRPITKWPNRIQT